MNKNPSINQFLEEVDPEKTIDRDKAMAEITAVTLISAIKDSKSKLSEEEQIRLDQFLEDKEKLNFDGIYELFENAGKKEALLASINDNINKVRTDYIKAHLGAMPSGKKEEVLTKFPALNDLLTPTPTT